MARYCKICGAKSGRCNHLIVDFGEREESSEKSKNDANKSETKIWQFIKITETFRGISPFFYRNYPKWQEKHDYIRDNNIFIT